MAATLREILLAPDIQPAVISDCKALITQEMTEKSGVSGTAVKLAFKTVTSFAPTYYQDKLVQFLPVLADELQPYWTEYGASGGSGFGDYLAKHGEKVTNALLSVTDARAESSGRPTIVKAYKAVRGSAAKHVEAALPRVGELVSKYAR